MSRLRSSLRALAALALVAGASALTAPVAGAQGIVAGTVRDEAGQPIAGARISIQRDSVMAVLTRSDGTFSVANVRSGQVMLEARKVGYRPVEAMLMVPRDSAVMVNITLVAIPQALPGVVVEAGISNQVRGVVIDKDDKPIEGAIVEIVGLGRKMSTGENGEFSFLDLPRGTYLMQWRKTGYTVAHRSVEMLPGIDRDMGVRLMPIGRSRYTAELAAIVAHEADRRQGLAGSMSVVIGRAELDKYGKARLEDMLPFSSGAIAMRDVAPGCVLVNGWEAATNNSAGALQRTVRTSRGPGSIMSPSNPGGMGGGTSLGGRPMPKIPSWLAHFRANEVEMIEIFPEGTEHSRTLCGRFPVSSGCSCPPEPAGIVIWLR